MTKKEGQNRQSTKDRQLPAEDTTGDGYETIDPAGVYIVPHSLQSPDPKYTALPARKQSKSPSGSVNCSHILPLVFIIVLLGGALGYLAWRVVKQDSEISDLTHEIIRIYKERPTQPDATTTHNENKDVVSTTPELTTMSMSVPSTTEKILITSRVTTSGIQSCAVDLVMLVDSSGSINDDDPSNWSRMMDFLKKLFGRIDISQTRASIVDFSDTSSVFFNLDNGYTTALQYQQAVDTLPYVGGNTNTSWGLLVVLEQVLKSRGNRPSVRDVVVVLTDGKPNRDVAKLPDSARRVRDAPALVVVIGITDSAERSTLEEIASGSDYIIQVEQFDQLVGKVDTVLTTIGACMT